MKLSDIIAKSNGTSWFDYSIAVANYAKSLATILTDNENIIELTWLCGFLHDIGKIFPDFQTYIKTGQGKYKLHNLSGAGILANEWFYIYNKSTTNSRRERDFYHDLVTRVILYHHPVNELTKESFVMNELPDDYESVLEEIREIVNSELKLFQIANIEIELTNKRLPGYYDTAKSLSGKLSKNDYMFMLSSVVKFADMYVNNPDFKDISTLRKYELSIDDIKKPDSFDDRFYEQLETAKELAQHKTAILKAPCGYGKTFVGLSYIIAAGREKAYWVCPINSIADRIYDTLVRDIKTIGLSDRYSVALLKANKFVYGDANADIIVTNIDNFLRPVISNDSIARSFSMLKSTVIIDEYHEYKSKSSLFGFFDIFSKIRSILNAKTLYLSATPDLHMFSPMLHDIPFIVRENEVINNKKYLVRFNNNVDGKRNITFTNSVYETQQLYNKGLVDMCVHNRFTETDKAKRIDRVIEEFSRDSVPSDSDLNFSSSPILCTGGDFSVDNINLVMPTLDRFDQSRGRCNRYNDNELHIVNINTEASFINSERKAIENCFDYKLHELWTDFLISSIEDNSYQTNEYLMSLRDKFIEKYENKYRSYINKLKTESYKNLGSISYDYIPQNSNEEEIDVKRIGKGKLRNVNNEEQFFCIVKDNYFGEYIKEPIIITSMMVNINLYNVDTSRIDKYLNEKYNKHKIAWIKKDSEIYLKHIKAFGKCESTPIYLKESAAVYDPDGIGLIIKKS